ncbi:MAG: chemotaxis protein CheX [Syntrophales bacterium]|nr:chemotaxis protein CheX [Syntrophales bacterium]MDY0043364.1 chemotaxis protein CheX [Syntrophales bacterium]
MARMMKMLENSISEVFEKMFFILLLPDTAAGSAGEYERASVIHFNGFESGCVKLSVSNTILEVMVHNMLNICEEDVSEEEKEDCIKEAVNMVCGNFLAAFDKDSLFELSIPECGPHDDFEPFGYRAAGKRFFICDDIRARIAVELFLRDKDPGIQVVRHLSR